MELEPAQIALTCFERGEGAVSDLAEVDALLMDQNASGVASVDLRNFR